MSTLAEHAREPGAYASAGLSILMHAVLVGLLIYGVRWQSRPADVVQVELVAAPSPPAAAPAPPVEAPKPDPKPEARSPPEQKPEPRPAPPPKADISVKEKEAPKAAPVPKPVPPKAEPGASRKLLEEQLKREEEQIAEQRTRIEAARDAEAARERQASLARERALAGWVDRIRAKIRGNITLPPGIHGNPEAVFEVTQLPSGEVLGVKLKRSTGTRALDEAIERAILKSSPLPKPDQPELFSRVLELRFRPLED